MKKILVLCTVNSCRSQMVEACLKSLLNKDDYSVYSAGLEAHGINPYMKRAMQKKGFSLQGHTSNVMSDYKDIVFDFVITVCDHASKNCPYFQNARCRIHHSFDDPADATGTEEEKMAIYEKVRDQVIDYCNRLVLEL